MRRTVGMLLAGGVGSRLGVLAMVRAKPAVPFGGAYRIIDFTLSNAANSGLNNLGILTQYKPLSLMKHVGTGAAWDWIGRTRRVEILPPRTGEKDSDWYRGTADAVAQNLDFIRDLNPERVLILSGDHIYWMDYGPMVDFHREKGADLTIAMMRVPWEDTRHFGVAVIDADQRIREWQEKPTEPKSNLASMGVYVFDTGYLFRALAERSGHDFGKHVVPKAVAEARVYAFPFEGYWRDVGTLRAYFEANRDLLPSRNLIRPQQWGVRTNWEEPGRKGDRPPSRYGPDASISDSLVSPGCRVSGEVVGSILSPGVVVEEGASVHNSILMHEVRVSRGATLDHVIVDKQVTIGPNCVIGTGPSDQPNRRYPDHVYTGLTILGKGCQIPEGTVIGRNCIVLPWVEASDFQTSVIPCGETVERNA